VGHRGGGFGGGIWIGPGAIYGYGAGPPSGLVVPSFMPVFMPALNRGLLGGPMPAIPEGRREPLVRVAARKPDTTRATQLLTFGDRLFRVGNIKRAADRYEQSLRADPTTATVHVRLAQVALVRGQYNTAADHFARRWRSSPTGS